MKGKTISFLLPGVWLALILLLHPRAGYADSRTNYLIDLLKNSGNFRVRVQSAKTLGKIGGSEKGEEQKKIVEALISACTDKNEIVRMTAAASLGSIGNPLAIPALEKLKKDKVKEVKEQATASIKKIKSIQEMAESSTSPDPSATETDMEEEPASDVALAYYVGIGSWSDKSGFEEYDTKDFVTKKLKSLLGGIPGVKVKPDSEPKKKSDKFVKKNKLTPYTLTGSIGKVKVGSKNSASAEISIIVLDREGNVKMMLKGKGSASMEGSKKSTKENEKELVLSALTTAVKGAVEPFSKQLQKSQKDSSGGSTKGSKGKKKKKKKKKK
jgi:hypothetical protein